MRSFIVLLAVLPFLGVVSCSKIPPPQYSDYTEKDLQSVLQKGLSRQDIEHLFGTPILEMELDETGYMLRFQRATKDDDLKGVNVFFIKDSLTRWTPWKKGEP